MPTTTARQTSRTNKGVPPAVVAGALKGADNQPAPQPAAPKKANITPFVTALKESFGFHKQALHVEMAVCLVYFFSVGNNDKKTRTALRDVYTKSGFDCKDTKGEDFKTVQRRTSVAAQLYDWLGSEETLKDWVAEAAPAEAIEAVKAKLVKQKFDSIQAIRKAVDLEKVKQEQAQAKKRQVERAQQEAAKLAARGPAQASVPASPAPSEAPAPTPQETPAVEGTADENTMLAEAAGKSDERKEAGEPAPAAALNRRLEDRLPPDRVLRTDHLRLAIPEETGWMELLQLSAQLNVLAQRMQAEAIKQPAMH